MERETSAVKQVLFLFHLKQSPRMNTIFSPQPTQYKNPPNTNIIKQPNSAIAASGRLSAKVLSTYTMTMLRPKPQERLTSKKASLDEAGKCGLAPAMRTAMETEARIAAVYNKRLIHKLLFFICVYFSTTIIPPFMTKRILRKSLIC